MYVCGFMFEQSLVDGAYHLGRLRCDDAIVVSRKIFRHLEEGASPLQGPWTGGGRSDSHVVSMTLSLVAVFIPLLLMGGIVGRLFREFATTVTIAIAVSALISLTLTPMLCARFLRPAHDGHGRLHQSVERIFESLTGAYRQALDVVLRHQGATLAVFFMTLAVSVGLFVPSKGSFRPGHCCRGLSSRPMTSLRQMKRVKRSPPSLRAIRTSGLAP